jgi:hypothetical protein
MAVNERSRKICLRWSWPAFVLAVLLIVTTGEGLLSFLARLQHDYPRAYAWLDLFATFVPFLLFVGLGLKTPAEEVRERVARLKQQYRSH